MLLHTGILKAKRFANKICYFPFSQFLRDHLRTTDVRLYVRDMLTEYARLLRFSPQRTPHAECMDWRRMLAEFAWPHFKEVSCACALRVLLSCV